MQTPEKKVNVVIAGGGTAGWLAAAALSQQMGNNVNITLVESNEIGTVGVGEATIPPMKTFHRLLRINEQEFMKATHATFKLGIKFEGWLKQGHDYFHSFGSTGNNTLITEFVHFWLRGRKENIAAEFGDYCLEYKAALDQRCSVTADTKINHAFHLDAGLYATFLKRLATARGVTRQEGKIVRVQQNPTTGFITALNLDSGTLVQGDFFLDCTGFKALLIEQTLHAGFEDWSHWLPCNGAVAVQTESVGAPPPYTRSIAHQAGWRWKIPLQHRVGNGLVYCKHYMSEDEACSKLLSEVEGNTLTEPNLLQFKTGKRRKNWVKNCVAVGLSAGFLEPLESTSIHLVMTAITRLLQLFPGKHINESAINEYNNQCDREIEKIRDFIILHYSATERDDSDFWRYCKAMGIPNDLAHRIALFKETGKSYQSEDELFRLDSWTQVMLGQGIQPKQYHAIVDTMKLEELKHFLQSHESKIAAAAAKLPRHGDYLKQYCGTD